ncbi:hypothetical protein ACFYTQ_31710 [Nocardia sp. NPDC004068]|uniref:hypothetical protein n=1 Tax=Nocardia sp. NPDC004068 TaxID=3364303 RepID=UPI0036CD53EA
MGAGRGYWAAQLAAAGVAVAAFDAEPPDRVENLSFRATPDQPDVWYPVDGLDRLGRTGPDDVLFLCWPPGWGNPMASLALAEFESTGGHTLVYIGEPKGGKTADDAFFDGLARRWELVAEDSDFVSWWNLADRAQYWRLR